MLTKPGSRSSPLYLITAAEFDAGDLGLTIEGKAAGSSRVRNEQAGFDVSRWGTCCVSSP